MHDDDKAEESFLTEAQEKAINELIAEMGLEFDKITLKYQAVGERLRIIFRGEING